MSSTEVEIVNETPVEEIQTHEETAVVAKPDVDPETTIFIGNVAIESTEDDIKKIFQEEFGEDLTIDIPETPRQRPNGHVPQSKHALVKFPIKIEFDSLKEKYDLTILNEREIHIKRARTSDELHAIAQRRFQNRGGFRGGRGGFRGGRGGFRGGRGGFRGGRGGFRGGRGGSVRRERIPLDQMNRSKDTIYVNNVPFSATKETLADFFGVPAEHIVLPMKKMRNYRSGRIYESDRLNRGIAFVTFDNLGDAEDAIQKKVDEFNGKTVENRMITVDVAVEKPERPEENESDFETDEEQDDHQEIDGQPKEEPEAEVAAEEA